jgi:WD40 repeat protein
MKTITTPTPIRSLLLLNSNQVAVGDTSGAIRTYNIDSGDLIFTLSNHTNNINSMIQLNTTFFISGSRDKSIKLWNVNTGTLANTLYTFSVEVNSLVKLNNGLISVAIAANSNNLLLMRTSDWTIQSSLTGHTYYVLSVILLSDGRLASGSADNTAIIWN